MSEEHRQTDKPKRGDSAAEARRLRQAEALRANLARRKQQDRARQDDTVNSSTQAPPDQQGPDVR